MRNSLVFKFSLLLIAFLFSFNLVSQSKDSIMAINRKFKKEIGIDMQGFFKSTPGTALILKVRNNSGRFISLTSSKNYRFQIALSGTLPTHENVTQADTSHGYYRTKAASTFSIQPMFGMEKVNFYGKFNFYYGLDFGPYYAYTNSGYSAFTYYNAGYYSANSSNGVLVQSESKTLGLTIAPFIGAKYRISEHFSVSIESSFYLSYVIAKTTFSSVPYLYNTGSSPYTIAERKYSGFNFSMKYLRFLTLNYHL